MDEVIVLQKNRLCQNRQFLNICLSILFIFYLNLYFLQTEYSNVQYFYFKTDVRESVVLKHGKRREDSCFSFKIYNVNANVTFYCIWKEKLSYKTCFCYWIWRQQTSTVFRFFSEVINNRSRSFGMLLVCRLSKLFIKHQFKLKLRLFVNMSQIISIALATKPIHVRNAGK